MNHSSAHEGDTALALATLVPYSSDGPTLPLIGGSVPSSRNTRPTTHAQTSNGKKRKADDNASEVTTTPETASKKAKPIDYDILKTPWTFLPPDLRHAVAHASDEKDWQWETHCVPVVYTRNQNIRTGANRLKAYLGHSRAKDSKVHVPTVLEKGAAKEGGSGIIAISAEGEATIKLVGIMELTKRVVSEADVSNSPGDGEAVGAEGKETWFSYTSLSSRVVEGEPIQKKPDDREEEDGGVSESEDGFEALPNPDKDGAGDRITKSRTVPVLTVWMTRRRIEGFRRAFGEQTFEVYSAPGRSA